MTRKFPKPILKWVGGKPQLLDIILPEFPREMNNYHEIFIGGGSILLALLSCNDIKIANKIYAYDVNEPLIYTYKNIQTNSDDLYNEIQHLISQLNQCGLGEVNRNSQTIEDAILSKENYYYWIRKKYNNLNDKTSVIASAMFIFLNKTCFRGIFRMGPNGFNVPYGHYTNPEILNKEHLYEFRNLIKDVIFICSDFESSLKNVKSNDFVYMDPPYVKEVNTSFDNYTVDKFDLEKHKKLFMLCNKLNAKFILSNSNTDTVKNEFIDEKYNIQIISAKRSINSKNPAARTNEVIIKNY